MKKSIKAQSVIEYAVVLSLIAATLLAMQVYIRRSYQAKLKDMTDAMLPPGNTGADYDIAQLAHINSVIPLLDPAAGKTASSDLNSTKSVTAQSGGGTLVYDIRTTGSMEMYIEQPDPTKDVNTSSGPNGPGGGDSPGPVPARPDYQPPPPPGG